jgi:hypothetical protein
MSRVFRSVVIASLLLGAGALVLLALASSPPARAAWPKEGDTPLSHATSQSAVAHAYPAGATLVPMGSGQADALSRRAAYLALWQAIAERRSLAWLAVTTTAGTESLAPGTVAGDLPGGDFAFTHASVPFSPAQALALQPARVALFDSAVRDEFGQGVVWERGDFEQLFRVYLWCPARPDGSCAYFDVLDEADIQAGDLSAYDLLIVPSIRTGWAISVAGRLGTAGLNAISQFWQNGGSLYAQSDGAYIAQAAGLMKLGAVKLNTRVSAPGNTAPLAIEQPEHPATFSWLSPALYVLDEPLFGQSVGVSVVARYTGGSHPGAPAVLASDNRVMREGWGRFVLVNGHPSDRQNDYPQVLSALLWLMSRRAELQGRVQQAFSPNVAPDLVPAYEAVPISVTSVFRNLWDGALQDVIVTETVQPGFTVNVTEVQPTPVRFIVQAPEGTIHLVWHFTQTLPGDTVMSYLARTATSTLSTGSARVSSAQASYRDPFDPRLAGQKRARYLSTTGDDGPDASVPNLYRIARSDLYISAQMAARLNGDRDIELDGWYPLPAEGIYYDLAGTLENKEDTDAHEVVVTDVVALLSPLVDVDDQTRLSHVVTDVSGGGVSVGESLWALNAIFFYSTPVPIYPLPRIDGVTASIGITYGLDYANTVYTYTGHFTTTHGLSNSVTIPQAYSNAITLTSEGLVLPALKMIYHLGTYPGYDYEDPAWRYGLFSQELYKRQVSFVSDPMLDQGVVASGFGCSVFTNLGGHPIPYHEYLSHTIISIPKGEEMPRAAYEDIWSRPYTMELRTVFYDIVPFPPPEYHAVVNTTFELRADLDRDGQRTDPVLNYPANKDVPADLHLLLKSYSNFAEPLNLRKDETLIAQAMFKGLGYSLEPREGTWEESWSFRNLQNKYPTATELVTVVSSPAYQSLYFQQELDWHRYEAIDVTATLRSLPQVHKEGTFKTNDGARFVYHQKALGPNRYEVFDSHVQAVFGLSADPQVVKQVAPVRVATYDDTVYHFIALSDPYDPRTLSYEPFIQSYGFGDLAATVSVGGRHAGQLLFPRIGPGGRTQVRIEINNNTGLTLTDLAITPLTSPGITVTARPTVETQAIEPLFFDFPFLHRSTVPDAWKTVWYFDVELANPFQGQRGVVYPISFTVSAGGLPSNFAVPPARIGVEDEDGRVREVYGQATKLELSDQLPPWMTLQDARIADTAEANVLASHLASGQDLTATLLFNALRGGVDTQVTSNTAGSLVNFRLPVTELPWEDGTLYVILRSRAQIEASGTRLANDGPALAYTDPFSQVYTVYGNAQHVEVHGAYLVGGYWLDGVWGSRLFTDGLVSGEVNVITVTASAANRGDYIARSTRLTLTLGTGVSLRSAQPLPAAAGLGWIVFEAGDLAPAQQWSVDLVLAMTPTGPGPRWTVIQFTDGRFINEFVAAAGATRQVVVTHRLADELELGQSPRLRRVYLPLILRHYPPWWPREKSE